MLGNSKHHFFKTLTLERRALPADITGETAPLGELVWLTSFDDAASASAVRNSRSELSFRSRREAVMHANTIAMQLIMYMMHCAASSHTNAVLSSVSSLLAAERVAGLSRLPVNRRAVAASFRYLRG